MVDRVLSEPVASADVSEDSIQVNPWMMLPFGLLLGTIALAPLLCFSWWNRHYPKIACGLAAVTITYYFVGLGAFGQVWHIAHEYLSFIVLIGSLFVVAGGIHINVKGEATPIANVIFLLIGAITANVLGTTGASMLLIRPWLRMNKYRVTAHHVVFFIFIVANVGGCLTPIGDPPLFLGYLMGVPFWWVAKYCYPMWCASLGILLVMFFILDRRNYLRAPKSVRKQMTQPHEEWRFEGLGNIIFLTIILAAVFINHPPLLRESLMIIATLGSYFTTRKAVHESNHFSFHPIQEVAILFIGIFATMMPALDWLQSNAGRLGDLTPSFLYWSSGLLSSTLDNAPTYLCLFKTILGRFVAANPEVIHQVNHLIQTHGADLMNVTGDHAEQIKQTFLAIQKHHPDDLASGKIGTAEIAITYMLGNVKFNSQILAISIGAVFFGANTYIGNGPNFMVKSIADQQKVHSPNFLGYVLRFTLPFMLPMLVIIWWLFFRG